MSITAENRPLPRRDDNQKKRAAPHLKKNLLPRWYSEKCFDFQGCD
jgi:hypothetical protein